MEWENRLSTLPKFENVISIPNSFKLGAVDIRWEEFANDPGFIFIEAKNGSIEDRFFAYELTKLELSRLGYLVTEIALPKESSKKIGTWQDVQNKAIRLYQGGNVQLLRNGYNNVVALVKGDDPSTQVDVVNHERVKPPPPYPQQTYEVEFTRNDPNSNVLTTSHCNCKFNDFRWDRNINRNLEGRVCFVPGSLVLLADGRYKSIETISSEDRVITHLSASQNVLHRWDNYFEGRLLSLKVAGYCFNPQMTEDHKVWANIGSRGLKKRSSSNQSYHLKKIVPNNNNWQMLKARKLRQGDWIQLAYPTQEEDFVLDVTTLNKKVLIDGDRVYQWYNRENHTYCPDHIKIRYKYGCPRFIIPSKDWLTILGYYLAEGNVANFNKNNEPKTIEWTFNKSEESTLVRELEHAIQNLGLGKLRTYGGGNKLTVKLSNVLVAQVLLYFCGKGAKNKILSKELHLLTRSKQKFFLEKYIEGDGCICNGTISAGTASPDLARQLFNIGCRVYDKPPSISVGYNSPGPIQRKRGYRREDGKYLLYKIKFNPSFTQGRLKLREGYIATQIRNISEDHYRGPVYDLEIENDHSYAVENQLVSNCSHILAAYYMSRSTPLDEDVHPATQYGVNPQGTLFSMPSQPGTATYPQGPQPQTEPGMMPGVGETPSQTPPLIAPEVSPAQMQLIPPSMLDLADMVAQMPVSAPGQTPPSPRNPMQWDNGTYSHFVKAQNEYVFQPGESVRINVPTYAQKMRGEGLTNTGEWANPGIDEGQWIEIPRNSIGTIFDYEPNLGYAVVDFPMRNARPTESYFARAYIEGNVLSPLDRDPRTSPFIQRRT